MIPPEKYAALTHINERGAAVLHRISPFSWAGVAATAGVRTRVVPGEFWAKSVNDHGDDIATVACPCGAEPVIPVLEIAACECQRYYFYGVHEVWSFNVPPSRVDESSAEAPA